jgi:hypothetical protein
MTQRTISTPNLPPRLSYRLYMHLVAIIQKSDGIFRSDRLNGGGAASWVHCAAWLRMSDVDPNSPKEKAGKLKS